MTRSDTLRAISRLVRGDHSAAIFALGYLTIEEETEVLERLLENLTEFDLQTQQPNHWAAYNERWGRTPKL